MPDDQLTLRERCVLFVLMAEARELTNAEMQAVAGVKLDGKERRRLNDLGLVASEKGKGGAYLHMLTDAGWVWCGEESAHEHPSRSGSAGGALYAVLGGLRRYLDDTGHPLADIFRPDVAGQVEAAYEQLTRGSGTPVRLAALRERLDGVPRDDVDRAIELLSKREGVHVRAESDQKTLTDEDRAAAVVLGGTPRHLLTIEVPQ